MRERLNSKIEDALNILLQATFQMNSHADNCAYWLAYNNFINTEKIFHERYAHKFPEWADFLSNFMIKIGGKPIRKNLEDNDYDYSDHIELFEDIETELNHYREIIYKTINTISSYNFREIINFLDDYLTELVTYTNQVSVWVNKAEEISTDFSKFDKYFKEFTFV